jgi:hypothetical protein
VDIGPDAMREKAKQRSDRSFRSRHSPHCNSGSHVIHEAADGLNSLRTGRHWSRDRLKVYETLVKQKDGVNALNFDLKMTSISDFNTIIAKRLERRLPWCQCGGYPAVTAILPVSVTIAQSYTLVFRLAFNRNGRERRYKAAQAQCQHFSP